MDDDEPPSLVVVDDTSTAEVDQSANSVPSVGDEPSIKVPITIVTGASPGYHCSDSQS